MGFMKFFGNDPIKALERQYADKLVEARDQQRHGDIVAFARITAEAEAIASQIDSLRESSNNAKE